MHQLSTPLKGLQQYQSTLSRRTPTGSTRSPTTSATSFSQHYWHKGDPQIPTQTWTCRPTRQRTPTHPDYQAEGGKAESVPRGQHGVVPSLQCPSNTLFGHFAMSSRPSCNDISPHTPTYNLSVKVESCKHEKQASPKSPSKPFTQWISLDGPQGERVRVEAYFDDGAMVNVLDEKFFNAIQHRLAKPTPSVRVMRMADGRAIPSKGVWNGMVELAGAKRKAAFEIFASGGAWKALFGKPLLEAFNAIHYYGPDEIQIAKDATNITDGTPKGGDWTQASRRVRWSRQSDDEGVEGLEGGPPGPLLHLWEWS
ncbi:hypothetical protein BJ165DRAFT_1531471 [Panaeolus papilionaceus]|nr:hypothetical protein BJ165DRAFT_1531471 [Panaeolus papilionaceus]